MSIPDYMHIRISADASLQRAIEVIDAGTIQIALVMDNEGFLLGTVTDGDIRRGILRGVGLDEPVALIMNPRALTAIIGTPRAELLALLTSRKLKQLPMLDDQGRVVGIELLDNLLISPALKENPVIILAGGQGARLRPLTSAIPKPLLKVGGRPVLELILQQLRAYGFHRLFISVHYMGNQVEEYFGDGSHHDVSIQYLREPKPLGTAGPLALMSVPQLLPCVVVNGDLVTTVSFEHMLEFHQEGGFNLTIGVKEYPFQIPYGVVTTQDNRVVAFREKPTESRLINTGVYMLDPEVLGMVPRGSYYNMDNLIEDVLSRPDMRVGAFVLHEYWMDIGTAADYMQAQQDYPAVFAGKGKQVG